MAAAGICLLGQRSEKTGAHLKQTYLGETKHQGLSLFRATEGAFIKFVQWHSNPYAPSLTRHKVNCKASL